MTGTTPEPSTPEPSTADEDVPKRSGFRRKRYALLSSALCVYAFVLLILMSVGRSSEAKPSELYATDVSCSRNWFVLGLVWDCTATVVGPLDGTRPYRSVNSLLTPDDEGERVPMSVVSDRRTGDSLRPTAVRPLPKAVWGASALGIAILWIVSVALFWKRPARPERTTTEVAGLRERAAALRARRRWPWYVGGVLAFYGAYVTWQVFVDDTVSGPRSAPVATGRGVVEGCHRDWDVLGATFTCDVRITLEGNSTWHSPDHRSATFTTRIGGSQFTPLDVGQEHGVRADESVNPFGPTSVWGAQTGAQRGWAATPAVVVLVLAGVVAGGVPGDRKRRSARLEAEAARSDVVEKDSAASNIT